VPSFYGSLQATASTLLQSKGQQITFTAIKTNHFDARLGQHETYTETYSGYGAPLSYINSMIDGELIKKGDLNLLLEATTTIPKQNDTCVIDGHQYTVKDVKPLSPGGTVVIYDIQLRR